MLLVVLMVECRVSLGSSMPWLFCPHLEEGGGGRRGTGQAWKIEYLLSRPQRAHWSGMHSPHTLLAVA